MGELIEFPIKNPSAYEALSEEQKDWWWQQLEAAERRVEYAKRMLGLLAVERGVEEENEQV